MANVDSPFGLRPIGNTVGGSDFQMTEYLIPDNEGTSIFQGDPVEIDDNNAGFIACLLYTSPSPRDMRRSRMPSSA